MMVNQKLIYKMNTEKRAVLAEINDFKGVYVQEMRSALNFLMK